MNRQAFSRSFMRRVFESGAVNTSPCCTSMDMPQPVRDLAIRGEVLTGVQPPEGRDVYAPIPPPASRRFRIGIILGHAQHSRTPSVPGLSLSP
jgi:hypothetical protein